MGPCRTLEHSPTGTMSLSLFLRYPGPQTWRLWTSSCFYTKICECLWSARTALKSLLILLNIRLWIYSSQPEHSCEWTKDQHDILISPAVFPFSLPPSLSLILSLSTTDCRSVFTLSISLSHIQLSLPISILLSLPFVLQLTFYWI